MRYLTCALLGVLLAASPAQAGELWSLGGGDQAFVPVPVDDPIRVEQDVYYLADSSGAEYELMFLGTFSARCRPTPQDPWRSITSAAVGGGAGNNLKGTAGIVNDRLMGWYPRDAGSHWEMMIWDISCAELYEGAPEVRAPVSMRAVIEPAPHWRPGRGGVVFRPAEGIAVVAGRACAGDRQVLWCLDDGPEPQLSLALVADTFSALLPEGVALMAPYVRLEPLEEPSESWQILARTALPEGGAVLVLSQGWGASQTASVQWVVRWDADDVLTPIFGPALRPPADARAQRPAPLGLATEVHFDPQWQAVWVGPVTAWQPAGLMRNGAEVGLHGFGYRVISLDGSGSGYLDLSPAWGQPPERQPHARIGAVSHFGGGLMRFRLPQSGPGGEVSRYGYELRLDRDSVDLDGDTLNQAMEAAAGTSDYHADTDADGVDDGMELIVGSDPVGSAPLEPALPEGLVPSPLLSARVGVDPSTVGPTDGGVFNHTTMWPRERSLNANAPLCRRDDSLTCDGADGTAGVRCVDAAGRTVADWCQDYYRAPVLSRDGRFMLITQQFRVDRLDLRTGARTVWFELDTVRPLLSDILDDQWATNQLLFYPIDEDRLFVTNTIDPFDALPNWTRVLFIDGSGRSRVIYDVFAESCDNAAAGTPGPGDCPDGRQWTNPFGRVYNDSSGGQLVVGWHAATERLMIALGGMPESYLVGLREEAAPLVLQQSLLLKNFAIERFDQPFETVLPTVFPGFYGVMPDGRYHTQWGMVGPLFERAPDNPWLVDPPARSDLYFHVLWNGTITDQRGVEWVPRQRRVHPGDTLFLGAVTITGREAPAYMLYGIGPKGGANPLWDGVSDLIEGPTGMALAEDGRLCVADRVGQQLVELSPNDDGSDVPRVVARRSEGDFIDCIYQGDTLLALLGDPPRVATVGREGVLSDPQPVVGAGEPAQLIATRDGYEVFWLDPGSDLRGYVHTADGQRAEWRNGTVSDGQGGTISINEGSLVQAVERPDGQLVLAFSTVRSRPFGPDAPLLASAPTLANAAGTGGPLVFLSDTGPHQALAQVPGGSSLDPWTGDDTVPCFDDPEQCGPAPQPGEDAGVGGAGGAGGADAGPGAQPDGDDGGCGCSADGASDGPGLTGLLLLLLAWPRRRR
jgi:MYXO-CTERM domain-containing protein